MQAPTSAFQDIAALSLYAFFVFFFVLVLWLHREGKREGYPLVSDRPDRPLRYPIEGFPATPEPKLFKLPHGHGTVVAPDAKKAERDVRGVLEPYDAYPGSSFVPKGDPMQDGVGMAAWADRADTPDLTWDDAVPKIVPLRAAPGWEVSTPETDIRGRALLDMNRKVVGVVVDLWVDKSDVLLRYVEVEMNAGYKRVVMPLGVVAWSGAGPVRCDVANEAQILAAPTLKHPDQITLLEEDKVSAYFGGAELYSTPNAIEPLV